MAHLSAQRLILTSVLALLATASALAQASLPTAARVTYNLFRNGVQMGVITEQFEHKGGKYVATSEGKAIGLFALVQRDPVRYISTGEITRDGLQPMRFEAQHRGKSGTVDFDWPAAKLNLTHDGLTYTLDMPPGTQDRLSIMYQIPYALAKKTPVMDFAMTNGRKLERYRYTVTPNVTIDVPFKRVSTTHLVKQQQGNESGTEIWVAPEYGNVAVKVLIVESDGVRYEQVATAVEVRP